jgi:hypothetical protein
MSDDKKGFTVKDRRHFTAEGAAREPAAATLASTEPIPSSTPTATAGRPAVSGAMPAGDAVDFSSFLLSLGAQAASLLAEGEAQGRSADALAAARQIISVIEMLQGKTEGRRTPEEDRLLESLLFEMRMAYVEASSGVRG